MTQRKDSKYKFEKNILSLSFEKEDINIAKTEWEIISDELLIDCGNNMCICQHVVKYKNFLINTKTFHTIIVGKTCLKKFEMNNNNKVTNGIIKKYIKSYKNKGTYNSINDIIKYSEDVKKDLVKYLYNEYLYKFNNKYNYDKYKEINDFYEELKLMILNYNVDFLNDFYKDFTTFINDYNKKYERYNKINSIINKIGYYNFKSYEIKTLIKSKIKENIDNTMIGNENEILCNIINNIDVNEYINIFSYINNFSEYINDILILIKDFKFDDLKNIYNDKLIEIEECNKQKQISENKKIEKSINHDYKKEMKIKNNIEFNEYYENINSDSLKNFIECYIDINNIKDKNELYENKNFEEYLISSMKKINKENCFDLIKIEKIYNIKIIELNNKMNKKSKTLNDFFK